MDVSAVRNPNDSGTDLMFSHCGTFFYIRKPSLSIFSEVLGSEGISDLSFRFENIYRLISYS